MHLSHEENFDELDMKLRKAETRVCKCRYTSSGTRSVALEGNHAEYFFGMKGQ